MLGVFEIRLQAFVFCTQLKGSSFLMFQFYQYINNSSGYFIEMWLYFPSQNNSWEETAELTANFKMVKTEEHFKALQITLKGESIFSALFCFFF